ncbi:MAG: caspase family protein [Kiritimatiellae bacterium]|nr:caspase family protein [Kiritimatiellia bacterium]
MKPCTKRRALAILAAGGLAGAAAPLRAAPEFTMPAYHALVIGINDYRHHGADGWTDLRTARGDAEAVGDVLEQKYGFEVTRLLDADATRATVLQALDRLVDYTRDDAVLVYFAGHGFYDETLDEGFWIPSDARWRTDGQPAREDWIWNAVLAKMIGASEARHILVIADSCFGGSLFRGAPAGAPSAEVGWYVNALARPSRYLIASGDLEPVADSGGRHSVFSRTLLNALEYPARGWCSASELGMSLRDTVSEMTGQMVRMGPLPGPAHAGGEFVLVEKSMPFEQLAREWLAEALSTGAVWQVAATWSPDRREQMRVLFDTALLDRRGATNTARRLLDRRLAAEPGDPLAALVNDYLRSAEKQRRRDETQALLQRIREGKNAGPREDPPADAPRPRTLAVLPPAPAAGVEEETAWLYETALLAAFREAGDFRVVEREAMEEILRELDLSASDVAAPELRMALGRLFPAGALLVVKLGAASGGDRLTVRMVDTQTSEILAALSEVIPPEDDPLARCRDLAARLARAWSQARP